VQRLLVSAFALTPMMTLSSNRAASAVLALAGVYQLTPLKRTCLSSCQSPVTFIARHWQSGLAGAFRNGRGARCVLHRMLLGADAAAVRGRRDAPHDDRLVDDRRPDRKNAAVRVLGSVVHLGKRKPAARPCDLGC
jgi:hypothetical protein